MLAVAILLHGCRGRVAPAAVPPPLQPVQGGWRLDHEKTLAAWQAERVPAAEIAQARAVGPSSRLHPDMTIVGDVAVLSGFPEGEYRFFALHPHDRWICGKAWHHEDRHDPGDMSKCYVRLEPKDGELRLSVRMEDAGAELDDPDVSEMPTTAGSAAECQADAAPEPDWSPWATFVFVKK
jgi:hypothetical protein